MVDLRNGETMTPTDHAELARLAEAATGGDWSFEERPSYMTHIVSTQKKGAICYIATRSGKWAEASRPNAAFIAAANPARVLALLAEIAALRVDLSRKHDACQIAQDQAMENGFRATEAKRQRDEAAEIMKDVQRCTQGPTLDRRITTFLASMEPTHDPRH